MGVEYNLTEVRIPEWETLAAEFYCKVHSHFGLINHMVIFWLEYTY